MMEDMAYFQIFRDMEELLEEYDDAEKGRLFSAMMAYAFRGEVARFEGPERYVWPAIRQKIDQSAAKYQRQKENGAKGGRPGKPTETQQNPEKATESQKKPTKPTESQQNHNKEQEQEQDKEQEKEYRESTAVSRRFTAPTPEEVRQFCSEHAICVDAQRFCDFYASKGWRVGNTPMKDWRAAVRNWGREQKNAPTSRAAPRILSAQNYTQRQYTENDLGGDALRKMLEEAAKMEADEKEGKYA